jgi:hypothetical protein
MYSDEEVLTVSQNIIDDEEPKFYQQAINGPNTDLSHSAIEAKIDALRRNHTWDVVERPTDRKLVDSKEGWNIKGVSDGSVDKVNARLVPQGFSQIER